MEKAFIVFRTYSFTNQAEMDLNVLKNEGIDAYLSDATLGSMSFLGAGTGGVKLHVAEKNLERAEEILPNKNS